MNQSTDYPYLADYEEWVVNSLKNKKEAAVYLQVAIEDYLEDGHLDAFLLALRHLAKAKGGMEKLAKDAEVGRESLYKTLSKNGNPKFNTIMQLLKSLGFQFLIKAI